MPAMLRRPIAALLFLGATAATAQYADPSYGGYAPPYQPQAPYQGGQPAMPAYQDDEQYGTTESYDSQDARPAPAQGYTAPPPQGGAGRADYDQQQRDYRQQLDHYDRQMRDYRAGRGGSPYADRAAALRARADACERGDDRACGDTDR